MAYKDSLTLYNELIATGISESQAQIQAQQLGGVTDLLVKIEKDLSWMRIIGAGMVAAYIANLVGILGLIVLMK
jgi:hypothetical protein